MNQDIQTIAALAAVGVAAAWLVRRFLAARRKPGCGGDCGCPSVEMKSKLRGR
jgi:hypothetical protein